MYTKKNSMSYAAFIQVTKSDHTVKTPHPFASYYSWYSYNIGFLHQLNKRTPLTCASTLLLYVRAAASPLSTAFSQIFKTETEKGAVFQQNNTTTKKI